MIVKDNLLKKLRSAFDLNIYEVKIWTALLSRGLATAGELSDISDVPRSRSYDVLESLEKKGFIMMKLGKPIKYLAIKPEEIVKRMKEHIQTDADNRVSFLDDVKKEEVFSELELLYKQGIKRVDIYSLSGAFKGRDSIYAYVKTLLENAEKSVVIVTTTEGLTRKIKRYKSTLNKISKKGVKIRILAPKANSIKGINEIKGCAEIKSVEKINARFVIVDDQDIVFMVADDKLVHESYDTGVWVKTPFFTKALSTMFESTWQSI